MQLTFSKIEPVRFGDFEATPEHLTEETKLRIRNLKFETVDQINEAKSTLAGVFGLKATDVREFMDANMGSSDLVDLQVYLSQGPQSYVEMKDTVRNTLNANVAKSVDKAEAKND